MRNCFQYPLDIKMYHYIKMKAYMRVEGGVTLYPGVDCPPLPQAIIDYVQRDEIGEIVSSILLKGFQKLQTTRFFSFPLSKHKK